MNKTLTFTILIILGFIGINAFFTMNEKQQGLVLQFGEPKRVVKDSGLHLKIPLIQNTVKYDKRILEYDLPIEEVIAVDKKNANRFIHKVQNYRSFRILQDSWNGIQRKK